ncbi:MAG: SDR family NAD(P)-dependent oxidoreductase, partial [Gemmatimonadota bacterium]|nr:SDR family NAD(P)-dependent oxidoreductase [Gemmatimonadota bacterium]
MPPWEVRNRWALVTGASSGIGEAFARALAARGAKLVLTARRADLLRSLADELADVHGIRAEAVPEDLAESGAPRRVWERATACGPIHLLVNNAGFGLQGRFDALPRERQREMVGLNCGALLELAHLALPGMRSRGEGGIVNVASIAGFQPIPGFATYAASKAFVIALSQAIREENRGAGVRVVVLCPGPVPTGFQEVAGTSRRLGSVGMR